MRSVKRFEDIPRGEYDIGLHLLQGLYYFGWIVSVKIADERKYVFPRKFFVLYFIFGKPHMMLLLLSVHV